MKKSVRLVLGVSLCIAAPGCAPADQDPGSMATEGALEGTGSVTVQVAEDTFVNSAYPTSSFGSKTELKVDDAVKIAYVKFNVSGVPSGATVNSAVLRLSGTAGGSQTVIVRQVGNTWNESTTYATRPALGAQVTTGTLAAGARASFTVPISGNGTFSFAIVRSSAGVDCVAASSEYGTAASRPTLTVSYTGGGTTGTDAGTDSGTGSSTDAGTDAGTDTGAGSSTDAGTDTGSGSIAGYLPYTANSFFKSRVDGTSVPIDATRTSQFHAFMASHPDQASTTWPKVNMSDSWAMSYDYGTASDPIWHLRGGNTGDSRLAVVAVGGRGFHMADSVAQTFPTGTQDRPGVIIDTASGFTVQFADAVPDLATRTITVSNAGIMWHSSNGLDYRNPQSNDNRNFTSRGRILDAMIVTREDLDRAVANDTGVGHVIHWFFVETDSSAGFVHPMVGAEAPRSGWGAEGERLRIKPSVDLRARGLTGHALALARTMQEHGAYLGDNSGSTTQIKLSQSSHYQGTNLSTDVFRGKLFWTDFEVVRAGWQ